VYRLLGAGDRSGAASTLTDLAFLAKRIALAGPHAAETDLAQAAAVHVGDPRIGWLRGWLARHGHVLAGLADPADVAVTLAGWLARPPAGIDRHRLDPLLPSLYPAPRRGLPVEPPTDRPPSSASFPATPAGCTRWRSAWTGGGSPPPVTTGRCGYGTARQQKR
jgi:hypothetical protein